MKLKPSDWLNGYSILLSAYYSQAAVEAFSHNAARISRWESIICLRYFRLHTSCSMYSPFFWEYILPSVKIDRNDTINTNTRCEYGNFCHHRPLRRALVCYHAWFPVYSKQTLYRYAWKLNNAPAIFMSNCYLTATSYFVATVNTANNSLNKPHSKWSQVTPREVSCRLQKTI